MMVSPQIEAVFMWSIVVLLGLVLGSFTSVLVARGGSGEGWLFNRSRCVHCENLLSFQDLIPVFSWLFLRGKCRFCDKEISKFYVLLEIFFVVLLLSFYWLLGFGAAFLFLAFAVPFFVALTVIDIKKYILPDELVLGLAVIGFIRVLFFAVAGVPVLGFLIGAIVYPLVIFGVSLIMNKVLKRETLGFGDVKFFAVAGLWLGVKALGAFLVLSGVFGVIFGVIWQMALKSKRFPFGPALIFAFVVVYLALDRLDFSGFLLYH